MSVGIDARDQILFMNNTSTTFQKRGNFSSKCTTGLASYNMTQIMHHDSSNQTKAPSSEKSFAIIKRPKIDKRVQKSE
jgi:hypothetical protein